MNLDPNAAAGSGFSIESIKQIVDGLDPAALLPDIQKIVGYIVPICRAAVLVGPILLLALGIAYLVLAPKEANHYFGYHTYFGMGSVHAWRYTQRLAGILLSASGLVLTVVMLVISTGFSGLSAMDAAWKAVRCLIWEAGTALAATLLIDLLVFLNFNRKGELRRKRSA